MRSGSAESRKQVVMAFGLCVLYVGLGVAFYTGIDGMTTVDAIYLSFSTMSAP